MKKLNYLLFTVLSCLCFTFVVNAAPSAKLTVSSSNITEGKTVTAKVTVYNTAAWNIKLISLGNTNGCSQSWADATSNGANATKTFSTTCRASSTGIISFTLSGDVTSSDGSNSNVSGSARVTVSEPRPASEVNTLKDLTIEGYTLSPEFNADTLEYTVDVPSTVNSVKINATKKDSASSIAGDGEVNVDEGANKIAIVVTAESGATKTYSITVNVKDDNPITVTIDGKEYTVIKNAKNLTIPNNYLLNTIKINDIEVPCFINDTNHLTLVALKDSEGNIYFFSYNAGNYQKYLELTATNLIIYPYAMDTIPYKGWQHTNISINNQTISALQYKKLTNYYLIYGMDVTTGTNNYYLYDSLNNTYQVFDEELFKSLIDDNNFYLDMLLGAAGLIFLCLIIIIALLNHKKKIVNNKKKEENIPSDNEVNPISDNTDTSTNNTEPVEVEPKKLSRKERRRLAKEQKKLAQEAKQTENTEDKVNENKEDKNNEDEEIYHILDD
jgi:hypothetical protein